MHSILLAVVNPGRIVATMEDAWDLEDVQLALRLDRKVKLLPCIAKDREKVKIVLLELLYSILQEMETGD